MTLQEIAARIPHTSDPKEAEMLIEQLINHRVLEETETGGIRLAHPKMLARQFRGIGNPWLSRIIREFAQAAVENS